ncbi:hypothetical protein ACSBOB_20735 [Mesorhizobium sp. ASY16-5R]|uniref:hypothetical protein n=1 Tax=Mesorhizobium sp. ASY16-5R TaxID=3445772 RepID=UPI003F9FB486
MTETTKPSPSEAFSFSGTRRASRFLPVDAVRVPWPASPEDRHAALTGWTCVAMRILTERRYSFRIVPVVLHFVNRKSGSLWPTNATMAQFAGGCSVDTITRDIAAFAVFGLLEIEMAALPGKPFKQRIMWLTTPVPSATDTDIGDDLVSAMDADGPSATDADPISATVADAPSATVAEQLYNRPSKETLEKTTERRARKRADFDFSNINFLEEIEAVEEALPEDHEYESADHRINFLRQRIGTDLKIKRGTADWLALADRVKSALAEMVEIARKRNAETEAMFDAEPPTPEEIFSKIEEAYRADPEHFCDQVLRPDYVNLRPYHNSPKRMRPRTVEDLKRFFSIKHEYEHIREAWNAANREARRRPRWFDSVQADYRDRIQHLREVFFQRNFPILDEVNRLYPLPEASPVSAKPDQPNTPNPIPAREPAESTRFLYQRFLTK